MDKFMSIPGFYRIIIIMIFAIIAHFVVKEIRKFSQWILTQKVKSDVSSKETFIRKYPKVATITTIIVSAVTFIIYFLAVGLILKEFKISLMTYLASASVIGLAIGFGLQGFVQDVVIGLTLIFTDVINIGDIVELSGQIGKVETIGLRFTTLINLYGQEIYVPNRNIGTIGRFHRGVIRAYVDIQLPGQIDEEKFVNEVQSLVKGMYHQHTSIILSQPEILGIKEAKPAHWRYLRLKFRIWPGQGTLIETAFKQRIIAVMKQYSTDYTDWMVIVTYRVE